ncbi:MAG: DUF2088 domain-containing protein [Deltaproteobacteria bacterium]|nr:DUF2088 domain-containing protein [Deltaproteobacteria bacterium]
MRPLFYSGTEVIAATLPEDARLVMPPPIGSGIGDVKAAVARALEQPVDGKPLDERVSELSRVLLVYDAPTFPVPSLRVDPRIAAIEAILEALAARGLPRESVTLLCSTGVTRLYRNTEIARVAGVTALASHTALCHDAEAIDRLVEVGKTSEGELVELNAAVTEADLVVSLAVAQAPVQGGWTTLIPGLASVACARTFLTAKNLAEGATPFDPSSRFQKALRRGGRLLERKVSIFHVELALDTRLWFKPVINLLRPEGEVPAPVAAWDRIPEPIRARASRLFRSEYQTIGVAAGSVNVAHAAVCDLLSSSNYAKVDSPADVVVLGVPAVTPHTLGSYDNPVLDVASAFGYVLAWHDGKPLVRKGGAVVLLTPLHERFDRPTHLPYVEFYEKVLAETREPAEMAERHEALFSGRPEYVAAYRRRHAYHGIQPFHAWYQAWNVLSRVGKVIVVGAQEQTARRFGFESAKSLEDALGRARDFAGGPTASVAAPVLPPAFGIKVA